ncbi:hypothetical protein MAPG_06586 [Magnaporthiopsis poae ATCC 64411]|uniref:Zn(2)-C6 fungal-type domain-containing protein n=1 Tax=Magnaporthiopsis poae (strain ATCC 64411 / 73-15) TaxID=644358 RepID=A0A0C4E2F0_MAGP6|nr:hypothetical protein MAPG_06586 [Magnaporthiopsis poae ATCC 64411]
MTDAMSYQYPPPPPHGVEMGMSSSAYAATYAPLPHSSEFGMGSEHDPNYSPRDRRDSFSTAMHLKRSMSTPNVRPELPLEQAHMQHQGQPVDHVSFLAADKRRNKLGYHRTSVACGHCRRRKIRCLPSSDDPEGRCINCIRLKKDCNFFPVDQQPAPAPADSRQKSGSRCSVGPGGVPPASSSPSIASGYPSDMHGGQHYTHPMAPSTECARGDGFYPDAKAVAGASTTRTFEYGHTAMTDWMPGDGAPSSSRSYSRESPVTPAFSSYTTNAAPSSTTWATPGSDDHSPRDSLPWPSYQTSSTRSMSFGSESLSSHHQHQHYQYPSISQMTSPDRSYDRRLPSLSGGMYPGPVVTGTGVENNPGTTLEHNTSLSAGAVPSSTYGSWNAQYSQGWYDQDRGVPDEHSHHLAESQSHGTGVYYASR